MPRARAILQSEYPYNITARCINRDWFTIPLPTVWQLFCEELHHAHNETGLLIHSFVLMSNHFHLIASTPNANISESMHLFMGRSSRRLTRLGNRINETFAGRHYKCILHTQIYYLNAYKYNYRNPIAAGISKQAEEYPFSTLRGLLRPEDLLVPLVKDSFFLADPMGALKWINQQPDPLKFEGVRFGLKRAYFSSKKNPKDNRPLIKDDELL